jgi:hypothetical protein
VVHEEEGEENIVGDLKGLHGSVVETEVSQMRCASQSMKVSIVKEKNMVILADEQLGRKVMDLWKRLVVHTVKALVKEPQNLERIPNHRKIETMMVPSQRTITRTQETKTEKIETKEAKDRMTEEIEEIEVVAVTREVVREGTTSETSQTAEIDKTTGGMGEGMMVVEVVGVEEDVVVLKTQGATVLASSPEGNHLREGEEAIQEVVEEEVAAVEVVIFLLHPQEVASVNHPASCKMDSWMETLI